MPLNWEYDGGAVRPAGGPTPGIQWRCTQEVVHPHVPVVVVYGELQAHFIPVVNLVEHGSEGKLDLADTLLLNRWRHSRETIWDNYCHLVSDTAIRPPDMCIFHPLISPPRPRLSASHRATLFIWNYLHSTRYTMLTMSQVSMLLLWVHYNKRVIFSCYTLPYICGGAFVFQGGGWGCQTPNGKVAGAQPPAINIVVKYYPFLCLPVSLYLCLCVFCFTSLH